MSSNRELEIKNEFDIESGISIATQYPLEKFHLRWKISNYSKIFNDIEVEFFTSSKSTAWKIKLNFGQKFDKVELWHFPPQKQNVRLHYQAAIQSSYEIREKEGNHEFGMSSLYSCVVLTVPRIKFDSSTNSYRNEIFENDVLDFRCTMIISGHNITRKCPTLTAPDFCSKQLNYDLENLFQSN